MQDQKSNLATTISTTRKQLGWSQELLAEKAKVSLSTIQRIEKGTVKPRAYTLHILAETLALPVTQLTTDSSPQEEGTIHFIALKRLNLVILSLFFMPLINLILPIVFCKSDKKLSFKDAIVGRMFSFQLLWSLITIIGMGITLFVANLIIGRAGEGLYFSFIFYFLAVLSNIVIIIQTTFQLNQKDKNALSFVPNLF